MTTEQKALFLRISKYFGLTLLLGVVALLAYSYYITRQQTQAAGSAIYKSKGANNEVIYSDRPTSGAVKVEMNDVKVNFIKLVTMDKTDDKNAPIKATDPLDYLRQENERNMQQIQDKTFEQMMEATEQ